MDQMWVVIGWIVAISMIVIALRLLLRKTQPLQPAESDHLHIDEQTQQPIIPRHLREELVDQSAFDIAAAPIESKAAVLNDVRETTPHAEAEKRSSVHEIDEANQNIEERDLNHDDIKGDRILDQIQPSATVEATNIDDEQEIPAQVSLPMQRLDSVDQNDDWQNNADILEAHLNEQNRHDEESALATAEQLVALYMYPNPDRALSGERTLKMMLKYGLRFGEMSCFHRYEHPEHPSPLMFSVLRINDDGTPTGFDLESLPNEEVKGLAFFLALPNPNAIQGFDMMSSIAGLIARDTDGLVFDEQSLELTPQLRDHWRHFVIEYRPA